MIPKDPNATKTYFVDWAGYLGTDTIVTSTWSASVDLTLSNPQIVSGTRAIVTIAGGIVGNTYKVTNHIITANAAIDDRSLELYIQEM